MTHRFLCCSDTRGQAPPALDETGASGWLHAGGVYDGWANADAPIDPMDNSPRPDLSLWQACTGVAAWLRGRIPVYAVRGNHDIKDPHGFFWKCDDLTGTVRRLADNLLLAGIGWAGEFFSDLPTENDLRDVCDVLAREVLRVGHDTDTLVLLSHYPPRMNLNDRGYGTVHELVFDLGPRAVICGDVPEWFGRQSESMSVLGGNLLVVHPGPTGGVLDLDANTGITLWHSAKARRAG